MTDIQIWQPPSADVVQYEPPSGPLDDWIRVADQVVRLAEVIANSPFVPNGLRGSVPATAAAILTGRELGVPPMTALANIHVIGGKPGLSALVMRALILSRGHEWQDVDVSDTRAIVRGRRKGEAEWTTATFTADQARTAKIVLGGYPQDKLYARATTRLARRKFADVIAGMPYSAEELEDGVVPDDDDQAAAPVPEPAKPRTARRARTQTAPPAPAAAPPKAGPADSAQDAGGALPPLPHEVEESSGPDKAEEPPGPDDTDYSTPGTATRGKGGQLTALWTVLSKEFGFTDDEKPQARAVCEHIIGRELIDPATGEHSTGNLSRNEAKTVLDTLAHWQQQAGDKGEHPRDYLIAVMAAQEEAGDDRA